MSRIMYYDRRGLLWIEMEISEIQAGFGKDLLIHGTLGQEETIIQFSSEVDIQKLFRAVNKLTGRT